MAEPIAIVGIGCRLPGGITSDSELWSFLKAGESGQGEIPATKFNIDAFYDQKRPQSGKLVMNRGYFLQEDERLFDNAFFGINNLEATYMDPQQRKLLEICYECFESAGVRLEDVAGANVGCYVGNFTSDFQTIQARDPENAHRYSATGIGTSILSNRISHAFDLRGPSLTIDTACSSSLYGIHLACTALERRDCDAAVIAAANLIQSVEQQILTSTAGFLSPTSTSHAFSISADGYARAEAVCALYVKRLSDAIKNNDPIRAVIRGTAVNSNGRTTGITLPSSRGQAAVISKAYQAANLTFDQVDYVECHGTGTPVGDPIEIRAVADSYNGAFKTRVDWKPLLVGSVKSSLGHSEAASGLTSIIKSILALENLEIPATIGTEELNPEIPWNTYGVQVVQKHEKWPSANAADRVPRASVNSFGYGGSNGHCVLERAPVSLLADGSMTDQPSDQGYYLLPVSAASAFSLQDRLLKMASLRLANFDMAGLTYTLSKRRTHFSQRGFLVAKQDLVSGETQTQASYESPLSSESMGRPLAFVFTGQGAQWPQMGKELYENSPIFRQSIHEMENHLQELFPEGLWSIGDQLLAPSDLSCVHLPEISQPLCTAIQIALVDLLRYWNIVPAYVVGHSSGEIAAAYAAGHISSRYAISAAYLRGIAVAKLDVSGGMMAVGMSSVSAQQLIEKHGLSRALCVACLNSPESVTISGDADAIESLFALLQAKGTFARALRTGGRAYHSHHMKEVGASYEAALAALVQSDVSCFEQTPSSSRGSTIMVSTVSTITVTAEMASEPSYWRRNLESPVLFSQAVQQVSMFNTPQFIEIGPHSALEMPIKQIQAKLRPTESFSFYFPALRRHRDSFVSVLELVGQLWCLGEEIPFELVNGGGAKPSQPPQTLHHLPTYTWDHAAPLWIESKASSEYRHRKFPRDELLGAIVAGTSGYTNTWRNHLSLADVPWLKDHRLGQKMVFPAAGYINMAAKACEQLSVRNDKSEVLDIEHLKIGEALLLPQSNPIDIFTELTPYRVTDSLDSARQWQFSITTIEEGKTVKHASGKISFVPGPLGLRRPLDLPGCTHETQSAQRWYSQFSKQSMDFGRSFQSLGSIQLDRSREEMSASAKLTALPDHLENCRGGYSYDLHPITIDALLQLSIISTTSGSVEKLRAKVPMSIEHISILPRSLESDLLTATARASSRIVKSGVALAQSELIGHHDEPLMLISGLRATPFHGSAEKLTSRQPMLRLVWKPDIRRITQESEDALERYVESQPVTTESDDLLPYHPLLQALHLYSHARCGFSVVELGASNDGLTEAIMTALCRGTPTQRYKTYSRGFFRDGEGLRCHQLNLGETTDCKGTISGDSAQLKFDLAIVTEAHLLPDYAKLKFLVNSIGSGGTILLLSPVETRLLHSVGLHTYTIKSEPPSISIVAAMKSEPKPNLSNTLSNRVDVPEEEIYIVTRTSEEEPGTLLRILSQKLSARFRFLALNDLETEVLPPNATVIVGAELEQPLLTETTERQHCCVQKLVQSASLILWLTGGNLLNSEKPIFAAACGFARSIRAEQASLRFLVLDLDGIGSGHDVTASNIISILRTSNDDGVDVEYRQRDGLLYISRFIPKTSKNLDFNIRKNPRTVGVPLREAGPCELFLGDYGHLDTLEFRRISRVQAVPSGHIEIEVKAVGLNPKDLYTLTGKLELTQDTCSCEYAGVVSRVGPSVTAFSVGDRVVSVGAGRFASYECAPAWACQRIRDDESFVCTSTALVSLMTAIHALGNLANLRSGESVLIHSAAGGVGLSAIQVAQRIGAEIFATVSTDEKRTMLIEDYGLRSDHIFGSRDERFLPELMHITDGEGVDVVLNSLTGEQLHRSLEACAEFGRFIEVGKRDILDSGSLNMRVFLRNLTFSSFDLHDLYNSKNLRRRELFSRLIENALDLRRTFKYPDPVVYDVSEVSAALRHVSSSNRVRKVAVSFEDRDSHIPLVPHKYLMRFDPAKAYLLAGCLGGLGRSISRYMLANGARNFIFIGRSGIAKEDARELVDELKRDGAAVTVITGDVGDVSAVLEGLSSLQAPLGGVVQAAMGLSESLFTAMSHEQWHAGMRAKTTGTWTLHDTIAGKDGQLDFFLMTSSVYGSIGSAAESNYCAANSFLDHFATYRRSLGLPATSIGFGQISEIGYLHEHPEVEKKLARKGLTPLTEDDVLHIVDIALSQQQTDGPESDHSSAHFIAGLEPSGIQAMRSLYSDGSQDIAKVDPRLSIVALEAPGDKSGEKGPASGAFPAAVAEALASSDAEALEAACFAVLAGKLAELVLMPREKITQRLALVEIGMDSMLAAEYRTFIFGTFGVDVPFLTLLSSKTAMSDVATAVCDGMSSKTDGV